MLHTGGAIGGRSYLKTDFTGPGCTGQFTMPQISAVS